MEERNHTVKKLQKQSSSLIASKGSDIVREVMPLMNLDKDFERMGFLKALERFQVTEKELEYGFWEAYADHFTPQSGIEFRHIYKHIKQKRDSRVIDGGTL